MERSLPKRSTSEDDAHPVLEQGEFTYCVCVCDSWIGAWARRVTSRRSVPPPRTPDFRRVLAYVLPSVSSCQVVGWNPVAGRVSVVFDLSSCLMGHSHGKLSGAVPVCMERVWTWIAHLVVWFHARVSCPLPHLPTVHGSDEFHQTLCVLQIHQQALPFT